jgi:hypothetical protein
MKVLANPAALKEINFHNAIVCGELNPRFQSGRTSLESTDSPMQVPSKSL